MSASGTFVGADGVAPVRSTPGEPCIIGQLRFSRVVYLPRFCVHFVRSRINITSEAGEGLGNGFPRQPTLLCLEMNRLLAVLQIRWPEHISLGLCEFDSELNHVEVVM